MDGIEVCGDPMAMVVAFQAPKLNIYAIGDAMTKRGMTSMSMFVVHIHVGWNLNVLQNPAAIHICCTLPTVPVVNDFLKDLKSSVEEVKANPTLDKNGMGAIYGMAASIPDKSLVDDITKAYLDVLTKI
jgi:sphinganine-1-phosphate aldolase